MENVPDFHFVQERAFSCALPNDRHEALRLEIRIEAALLNGHLSSRGEVVVDGCRIHYRVSDRTIYLLSIE